MVLTELFLIEQDRAFQLGRKVLVQIFRSSLTGKRLEQAALLHQLFEQRAMLGVARQVLLDLGTALRVEIAVDVSTELGFNVFCIRHRFAVGAGLRPALL